jgi:hypothetical protein
MFVESNPNSALEAINAFLFAEPQRSSWKEYEVQAQLS